METKACTWCKRELPIEKFAWKNKKRGKRQWHCRDCQAIYIRKHYRENLDYYKQKAKESEIRFKKWWKEYKSAFSCIVCDESYSACIEFHHLDPTKKEANIGTLAGSFSRRAIRKEMKKCVSVCANCHRKIHGGIINIERFI